jgi:hypothetical protein
MDGGLFVAHINNFDVLVKAAVVYRHHVATRKSEHTIHSGGFQGLRRQLSSMRHNAHTPPAAPAANKHDCTLR